MIVLIRKDARGGGLVWYGVIFMVFVVLLVAMIPLEVSAGTGSIIIEEPGFWDASSTFDLYFENVFEDDVIYWWWTSDGFLDFSIMDPGGAIIEDRLYQTGSTGQFVADYSGTYHFIFVNKGDKNVAVDYDVHTVSMSEETRKIISWIIFILIIIVVVVILFVLVEKQQASTPITQTAPVQHQSVTAGFCSRCGTTNVHQARFCNGCGGSIHQRR